MQILKNNNKTQTKNILKLKFTTLFFYFHKKKFDKKKKKKKEKKKRKRGAWTLEDGPFSHFQRVSGSHGNMFRPRDPGPARLLLLLLLVASWVARSFASRARISCVRSRDLRLLWLTGGGFPEL
jgi:hypothetical protein